LARRSFRDFIYTQIGYNPINQVPLAWRQFYDRVSLVYDSVPSGYFCIFKEMANVIVTLINGGAIVDSHFIPDISVGRTWSEHWKDRGFDASLGSRIQYAHNYPEYFPQAASNPQATFCYPDAALGEFRRWMREQYIPGKFPAYLSSKVRHGALTVAFSEKAVRALTANGQRKRIA
jgi:hypothetical protein